MWSWPGSLRFPKLPGFRQLPHSTVRILRCFQWHTSFWISLYLAVKVTVLPPMAFADATFSKIKEENGV